MAYNLQQRLDVFVSGECSLDAFAKEVFVLCNEAPDSAWDVLSLIDQYYRRGKLSADLFHTIKYRIVRHVLGVPESLTARESPDATAAAEATIDVGRGAAVAMPEQSSRAKEPVNEVPAPQFELPDTREPRHRYRKYLALLGEFRRRIRSALALAQCKLRTWLSRINGYPERMRGGWGRLLRGRINGKLPGTSVTRDPMRIWRRVRLFEAIPVAAVLLGVTALPAPQDLKSDRDTGKVALPNPVAVEGPQIADPKQISLSADRYIVFPGHTSAEIQVRRTGGASGEVSFVWWTQGSRGAKPGRDYASRAPEIAHLLDGAETLRLSVPIIANPKRRHTELFYVVIGEPDGGASLGSVRRAAVFILRPD